MRFRTYFKFTLTLLLKYCFLPLVNILQVTLFYEHEHLPSTESINVTPPPSATLNLKIEK